MDDVVEIKKRQEEAFIKVYPKGQEYWNIDRSNPYGRAGQQPKQEDKPQEVKKQRDRSVSDSSDDENCIVIGNKKPEEEVKKSEDTPTAFLGGTKSVSNSSDDENTIVIKPTQTKETSEPKDIKEDKAQKQQAGYASDNSVSNSD